MANNTAQRLSSNQTGGIEPIPNSFFGKNKRGDYFVRFGKTGWRAATPDEKAKAIDLINQQANPDASSPNNVLRPNFGQQGSINQGVPDIARVRGNSATPQSDGAKQWVQEIKEKTKNPVNLPSQGAIGDQTGDGQTDDEQEQDGQDGKMPRGEMGGSEAGEDGASSNTDSPAHYDEAGNLTGGGFKRPAGKIGRSRIQPKPNQSGKKGITAKTANTTTGHPDKPTASTSSSQNSGQAIANKLKEEARKKALETSVKIAAKVGQIIMQIIFLIIANLPILSVILVVVAFIALIITILGNMLGWFGGLIWGGDSTSNSDSSVAAGTLACTASGVNFVDLPTASDTASKFSKGVTAIQNGLSSSVSTGVLLNGIVQYSTASGKPLEHCLLVIPWLITESSGGLPDPYLFNCRENSDKYNISIPCKLEHSGFGSKMVQVGGYQFQNRTGDFKEVFTACYGSDNHSKKLKSVLQKVYDNSDKATHQEWNYKNPIYKNFVDQYLFGGVFPENIYLEGMGGNPSSDIIINPQEAYDNPTNLQNQALAFLLGKDPCMVAGLNSYAVNSNMTAVKTCPPPPKTGDWYNCSTYYQDRKQLLADAAKATGQWACAS